MLLVIRYFLKIFIYLIIKKYNGDCTWDDSLAGYDYFNLSDAENKSHRRMEFSVYLPPCVSSDYKPASGQETIDAGSEASSAANNGILIFQ